MDMSQARIIPLGPESKGAAMEVLNSAFARHPFFPPRTPARTTAAFLRLLVDDFAPPGRSFMFGGFLPGEERLGCVALAIDADYEPKGLALVLFFWRTFQALGLRLTLDFIRGFSGRPQYDAPYLDLMLLGTTPEAQGKGLGRNMLHMLFDFAQERGFNGMTLGVAKETPARGLYEKEGFVLDKEIMFSSMPICLMRRDNQR